MLVDVLKAVVRLKAEDDNERSFFKNIVRLWRASVGEIEEEAIYGWSFFRRHNR